MTVLLAGGHGFVEIAVKSTSAFGNDAVKFVFYDLGPNKQRWTI